MLDINHIPGQSDNVQIFYTQGTNAWQTWRKPRNCNNVWIMCIGGASGGYGGSNSAGFNGGSGGGSGGVVRALFQANVLPDILYVQPGTGGAGGVGGAVATSGTRSFVVINPSGSVPAVMNIVCTSGTAAASFATGETVTTVAAAGLLSLGTFQAVAGVNAGGNSTPLSTTITCQGCQGGGSSAGSEAGFSVLATALSPLIAGGTTISPNAASGIWSWKPMFGLGGAGGAGSVAGVVGGNGGNGTFGCGGGGGGSSSAGGGTGGKGGDGLVIIATF
jgi:hypothetical protein